jgi:hypothetical protein
MIEKDILDGKKIKWIKVNERNECVVIASNRLQEV